MWFFFSYKSPLLQINNENLEPPTLIWGNLIAKKSKARLKRELSVSTTDENHVWV